jgi:outer membrane protein assembly factor BamE
MKKIFFFFAMILTLSACVHKMDIEQGNIITQDMVNQLHTGMNEEQTKEIMGSPMLINTFNDNRIDYIYTFKAGHGKQTEKQMTLTFKNHRLQAINGNMYSQYMR